jgi:hypothetical protein
MILGGFIFDWRIIKMKLNLERMKKFFKENGDDYLYIDYNTHELLHEHQLKKCQVVEYAIEYDIETRVAIYMGYEDFVDLDNIQGHSMITIETCNGLENPRKKVWETFDNPEQTPLLTLVENGAFEEGTLIRITDINGSHRVIDEVKGLTDPYGIYLVAVKPEDFIDAYGEAVVKAVYDDEDDDEEEDHDHHPLEGCSLSLVPGSHIVNYIGRYKHIATIAKMLKN